MKLDTALNVITGAATVVGGGMIFIYGPEELSTVSVPGVTVFVCFLVVLARVLWNLRDIQVEAKVAKARRETEDAGKE